MLKKKMILIGVLLASVVSWGGTMHDPSVPEELRMRKGLSNFFQKINTEKEVRVAYLGGSITKAEGWRVKSFAWLEAQYPTVDFVHINAAVGGTGADYGVCRVEKEVLQHKPDLVFVEYRVNGGGDHPELAYEGVIRRIWEADPTIDICYVYTIGQWMLEPISNGKQYHWGAMMETLANHYGIPSIDLGVEVAKRWKAGTLSFKSPVREEGKLWFTKDPCHPTDEGADLYRDIVARSFIQLSQLPIQPGPHAFPAELHKNHYHKAKYQPITSAKLKGAWESVDRKNDAIYTNNEFRTNVMLDEAVKTAQEGDSFTVEWDGPYIVFTHIPQKKGIKVEVSVDGQPAKKFSFEQRKGKTLYARHFYLPQQSEGHHRATLTVTQLPEGLVYYAGQFLVLTP